MQTGFCAAILNHFYRESLISGKHSLNFVVHEGSIILPGINLPGATTPVWPLTPGEMLRFIFLMMAK